MPHGSGALARRLRPPRGRASWRESSEGLSGLRNSWRWREQYPRGPGEDLGPGWKGGCDRRKRKGGGVEGRPLGSHGAWLGCQLLLVSCQAPRDPEPRCRTSLNYGSSEARAGADADTSLQSGWLSPPASRHCPICHIARLRLRGRHGPKQGGGQSEIQVQVGSAHPTPTPPAPAPWTAPSGLCPLLLG